MLRKRMSNCELVLCCKINKFDEVKSFLELEGYDAQTDCMINNENKRNKCCTSVASLFSFMCFAQGTKAVFLQGTPQNNQGHFDVCWKGNVIEESDTVTSVLCLPLLSKKQSSFGDPDWVCIIIGFKSGKINFYTENGLCLMSHEFHQTPAVDIQCNTDLQFQLENRPTSESSELNILYEDVIVVINGHTLFQELRVCRTKHALASAYGTTASFSAPLTFRKLQFIGQETILSFFNRGLVSSSPFDDLQNLTINGGYNAEVSLTNPPVHEIVTSGFGPYVGFFFYPDESEFQLSHVASAVASKLKTAIYSAANSWWNWNQKDVDLNNDDQKQQITKGQPMEIAHGLPDSRRQGHSICLAPGCNWLAAVTDSFGRIILLDITDGYILRMWKGYRDAQVSFMRVFDETQKDNIKNSHNSSLFLVVFAPKRGILEVWCCIFGPRVAAFNINRTSRLLKVGHETLMPDHAVENNRMKTWCCIISIDGQISSINIPFHVALSDSSSNRARHIHLLKKINFLLHSEKPDENEILGILLKMDMSSFQQQAFEQVLKKNIVHCPTIRSCVNTILKRLTEQDQYKEEREFLRFLKHVISVLNMYEDIQQISKDSKINVDNTLRSDEMTQIQTGFENKKNVFATFYAFFDPSKKSFLHLEDANFLSVSTCLEYFSADKNGMCNMENSFGDSNKLQMIGHFLFSPSFCNGSLPANVLFVMNKFGKILDDDLLFLLFSYFVESESKMCKDLTKHSLVLLEYMKLIAVKSIEDHGEYKCTKILNLIRDNVCQEKKSTPACYMVAFVCDIFIQWLQSTGTSTCDIASFEEPLERVDDCFHVNVLLAIAHTAHVPASQINLSSLVCVSDVLQNGRGHIPELLSRALGRSEVSCKMLFSETLDVTLSEHWKEFVVFWRTHMKMRFPFCINENSLRAHCFWDKVAEWNKSPKDIHLFSDGLWILKQIKYFPRLQHGLASMAWRAFVNKKISLLSNLIEKIGRLPKDRICIKDIGINADKMTEFCQCCFELIQIFAATDSSYKSNFCQSDTAELLNGFENLRCWISINNKESIVEIAEIQPQCNLHLIYHRLCLTLILKGLVQFKIRGYKPLTQFFTSKVLHNLFSETSSSDILLCSDEKDLMYARTKVFQRILSEALKMCSIDDSIKWYENCTQYSEEIHVNENQVTVHFVEELVRCGQDTTAFKFIKLVQDETLIATKLMSLLGKRLAMYVKNLQHGAHVMILSQMPPSVSSWIKAQNILDVTHTDLESSIYLANHIISVLPETHEQYQFVALVLETLKAMSKRIDSFKEEL
uniref:Rab3 GTPase-activating protein non-catalytic subunit n=1 Tax=Phallusia mammillata TaxID=59560 RepID=A0A6F9DR45_9ASCI|nr:rab3 GTPase-activating protein non-catalytic subunit [Phallusia mammillata]